MQELGYLYVLANSAMPNMVKVGKTTRSSSERAEELSRATGLPTPFIVVYEQLFENCGEAETFVHVYLEEKGYRVANNREFFNAPVDIVVEAIALAPNAIDHESLTLKSEDDDLLGQSESDELDDLYLDENEPSYPWTTLFNEAEAYYNGDGDYIQDYGEAMRLFRQAAKLGALSAYGYIAKMYRDGEGVHQDSGKAIEFYKEGARKGNVYCYWGMGAVFHLERHSQNAEKCFSLFMKNISQIKPDTQKMLKRDRSIPLGECFSFMSGFLGEIPPSVSKFILENSEELSEIAKHIGGDTLERVTKYFESLS